MTKVLEATCENEEVVAEDLHIPSTKILSKGVGPSEGVLILESGKKTYIPDTQPDLETTLVNLIEALDKAILGLQNAASALTSIDTAGYLISSDPDVPSPPVASGAISGVNDAASGIESAKGELETLKGMLR